jgi:hypothetical protein
MRATPTIHTSLEVTGETVVTQQKISTERSAHGEIFRDQTISFHVITPQMLYPSIYKIIPSCLRSVSLSTLKYLEKHL